MTAQEVTIQYGIKIVAQGNTADVAESFTVRPNAKNTELLDSVLNQIPLSEQIYTEVEFKNPTNKQTIKLICSLSKTDGKYLLASSGVSGAQVMPGRDDEIIGVSQLKIVGKEDAKISLYKKIDSIETALEKSRGQLVRIHTSRHESEDFYIQSIDRQGVVTAIRMDHVGEQQEVNFQISRNKCLFAPGTEDEYSQPVHSISQLTGHIQAQAKDPKEGLVTPMIPVLGQRGQVVDELSALDLIAIGSEVRIKIKVPGISSSRESEFKTTWLGIKNDHIIVGDPKAVAGVDSYPLTDVLAISTKPQFGDQKDLTSILETEKTISRREIGHSTTVQLHPNSAKDFDLKVVAEIYRPRG